MLNRNREGWLDVTPDFIRAYLTRPEVHPVEESCPREIAIFEKLMADPFARIDDLELAKIADADMVENYRLVLSYRDHLVKAGTLEAAYMHLFAGENLQLPPVFIDQLVHVILRNILEDVVDPVELKTAELFFREQTVTVGQDQLIMADHEIVEMKTRDGFGGLGQLLAQAGTPMREVTMDVMTEENKNEWFSRSEQFDMAIDFRFTQPAPDAFARVIEKWLSHFLKIETRIQAMKSIRDERWSWHVGLDPEASRILNALYEGRELEEDELYRIIALYRVEFLDNSDLLESMSGKPVYLALAMNSEKRLVLKPQNLLVNLPLASR